jgi:SHS2 domain-containing protein
VYEIFDHTADLGLRVRAPDPAHLCEDAARGLTAIIAGDVEQIRPVVDRTFQVPGREPSFVLLDWLNELLYEFETRRMLFSSFKVTLDEVGLRAVARGESYDPARHRLAHEVKGITYHGLSVQEQNGRWEATVIVDI